MFFNFPDSQWMAHQLENLKTWNQRAYHSQRTSQWGYTQACGMQTSGPQGVGWWRQTGPWPLSLLPTGVSVLKWAHFSHRNWTQPANKGSNGSKIIIWSIIIAPTQKGFHKAFLLNALPLNLIEVSMWAFFCLWISIMYKVLLHLCWVLVVVMQPCVVKYNIYVSYKNNIFF